MKTFTRREALRSMSLSAAGALWSSSLFANYSIPTGRAEVFSNNMPEDAMEAVSELSPYGIASFSFTPRGGWLVVSEDGQQRSKSIPAECKAKIEAFVKAGHRILAVAFPPMGVSSYLIITDKDFAANQIDGKLKQRLTSLKSKGVKVRYAAFRPKKDNGRWILITEKGVIAQNIQDDCFQMVENLQQSPKPNTSPTRDIHHVSFSPTGGWIVAANDIFKTKNIPQGCLTKMKNAKGQYMQVDLVTFAPKGGGWCVISNQSIKNQPLDEIRAFEKEIRGGGIWARMNISKIPGVTVAAVVNNQLAWSCGYGFLKKGDVHAVHNDSLFQAGSMSQLVSTIGALRMVKQGRIGLEEDIRDEKFGFDIPIIANELLEGQEPNLSMILANRCGMNVKGLRGYSAGQKLPTIDNILKGTGGANNAPIKIETAPNTNFSPSAGGFIVLDKLIQSISSQPSSKWLNENVLSPLNMSDSTFNISPDKKYFDDKNVAAGHNPTGRILPGERLKYPETSAYGLHSNVKDLSNIISMINQGGRFNGQTFLTTDLVEALLTPVNELEKTTRGLGGLAVTSFEDINDDGSNFRYSTSGQCGGFRSLMMGYPIQGTGVVVMTNGNGRDGARFSYDVAMSVAKAYGWE